MTKLICLVDMDSTTCDYTGALQTHLDALQGPNEERYIVAFDGKEPEYIKNRMRLIKSQPGWWKNLDPIHSMLKLLKLIENLGFTLHILTQGPTSSPRAWTEKFEWVQENLGTDVPITITRDKGLVYGKILIDDYPEYILAWLQHRSKGLVIMPDHPWNQNFDHPQVIRFKDGNYDDVINRIYNLIQSSSSTFG